jgi:SHS2 domain-containing protein
VEHTSELTVRLRAPDFAELVAEATRAFMELVPRGVRERADPDWRTFTIEAPDRTAALVAWLNEIVYLCEAEQWLPTEVAVGYGDGVLSVRACGETLSAPFVTVKAATFHRASVREGTEGFEVEVTLDV